MRNFNVILFKFSMYLSHCCCCCCFFPPSFKIQMQKKKVKNWRIKPFSNKIRSFRFIILIIITFLFNFFFFFFFYLRLFKNSNNEFRYVRLSSLTDFFLNFKYLPYLILISNKKRKERKKTK